MVPSRGRRESATAAGRGRSEGRLRQVEKVGQGGVRGEQWFVSIHSIHTVEDIVSVTVTL